MLMKIRDKVDSLIIKTQCALANRKAEGYVDSGVKILIAVVVGAIVLAGLYGLMNTDILPTIKAKVIAMFNYGT